MKKVLMVAFHYPPDNSSSGVLRTLKFSEYLHAFGWKVHVLTVRPDLYEYRDEELCTRIPSSVAVTRVWCPDIKRHLGMFGCYPGWLCLPDRFNGWIVSGYSRGMEILRKEKCCLIYSTQPVPSAHLLAWRLSRATGVPWVADFRDPWVDPTMTGLRGGVERWLELGVIRRSQRVICNTPRMREDFLRRYPGVEPWRFVVIPNGYDEADFGWLEGAENGGPFTVVYPGIVDGGNRNPVPLIQSVGLAIKAGEIPAEEIRLCFLGGGPYLFGDEVEGALRDWNLTRQTVRVRDRVSYRESLSRLAVADVLIVLSEPVGRGPWLDGERAYSRLMVPAKVYEYMRLGRPILALVGDGAVKDLFTELEAGQAVAPDDPEMAARFLVGCYTARAEARYRERRCPGGLGRYERRALTERLAAEFESVTVGVGG